MIKYKDYPSNEWIANYLTMDGGTLLYKESGNRELCFFRLCGHTTKPLQNLLDKLWRYDFYGDGRVVDTHIKNLRKKLGIELIFYRAIGKITSFLVLTFMAVSEILNMKYHEIIRAVPDLQMDVEGLQFPEKLFIQSYDIGIILGRGHGRHRMTEGSPLKFF